MCYFKRTFFREAMWPVWRNIFLIVSLSYEGSQRDQAAAMSHKQRWWDHWYFLYKEAYSKYLSCTNMARYTKTSQETAIFMSETWPKSQIQLYIYIYVRVPKPWLYENVCVFLCVLCSCSCKHGCFLSGIRHMSHASRKLAWRASQHCESQCSWIDWCHWSTYGKIVGSLIQGCWSTSNVTASEAFSHLQIGVLSPL